MPCIMHHTSINKELGKQGLPEATILASPTVEVISASAGLSAGALAGIIVGAIAVVGAFAAGAYFLARSSQKTPDTQVARKTSLERIRKARKKGHDLTKKFCIQLLQGPPSIGVPPSSQPALPQTTVPSTTTTITSVIVQPAGSQFCSNCGKPGACTCNCWP